MAIVGYDRIGANTNTGLDGTTAAGCRVYNPVAGVADLISSYHYMTAAATGNMRFSIYAGTFLKPLNQIWVSPSSVGVTNTAQWASDTPNVLVPSDVYLWLFSWADDTSTIHYDLGTTNQAVVEFGLDSFFWNWENRWDGTNENFDPSTLSIYINVTPIGSEPYRRPAIRPALFTNGNSR